jgi:hypothetical protein
MNYEVHLNTVFATPELAEEFMKIIMKQLNDITFNGESKIEKVIQFGGSASVRVPKFRKCEQASYSFGCTKHSKITLD